MLDMTIQDSPLGWRYAPVSHHLETFRTYSVHDLNTLLFVSNLELEEHQHQADGQQLGPKFMEHHPLDVGWLHS
ncbi:hypothetical protein CERSUDRAFT_101497 [Gelatoporia subvermispora B]|uniref:Uncharacterized protein n=1 Tax=Ceriporiopsis subvermispora (strain B) TaxID=914234 RepID=M2QV08_CERS8|nr:hypothetical protein CERSUDRAFT_101497 [Gelatoporia subvermispora B]